MNPLPSPVPAMPILPPVRPATARDRAPRRLIRQMARIAVLCALAMAAPAARANQSLAELEERAVQAAAQAVAPSLVKIETVGGMERVGQFLVGTGPTTGLVVSADGLIISSAFNFIQKPDSILVTLADGTRLPAKLVATDHSRMLVLLSVHASGPLTPAEAAPPEEVRVGQWAIAVGRTLSADSPNVSVGIVSALDRVWGRAIQTDAKISPTNYGGPLVDIAGRVLGILVPLAPDSTSLVAGVEWYDSGIGFAVPLSGVQNVLPRLAAGNDLYPGLLGIGMKGGDVFAQAAEIAACRPRSPATAAGLKAGDTIVEIDGKPVTRQAQFKQELSRHYAGDRVRLIVMRSGERIEREIELTDKIPPYEFPFAGLLPLRPLASKPAELVVRAVYPDGPAARAGIQAGDRIVTFDGAAVQSAEQAADKIRLRLPGDKIAMEIRRGDQTLAKELELVSLPEEVPAELPAPHGPVETKGAEPAVGVVSLETEGCWAYVPTNYQSELRYGVVIWLHGPDAEKQDDLVARWKARCRSARFDPAGPQVGRPGEMAGLRRPHGDDGARRTGERLWPRSSSGRRSRLPARGLDGLSGGFRPRRSDSWHRGGRGAAARLADAAGERSAESDGDLFGRGARRPVGGGRHRLGAFAGHEIPRDQENAGGRAALSGR